MNIVSRAFRGMFRQRLLWALLWALMILTAAAAVNAVGIYVIGNVNGWSFWLKNHGGYFLMWRLCLYSLTGYGWWWMRKRILHREPSAETRSRLFRSEIAAVLTVLVLEGTVFLQSP